MDFSPASKGSVMLSQSNHWSGGRRVSQTCSAAPVIRYTDSTRVVVSTDVGFLIFLILTHRRVVETALLAPMPLREVTISTRYYCMLFDVHAGVTSFKDA